MRLCAHAIMKVFRWTPLHRHRVSGRVCVACPELTFVVWLLTWWTLVTNLDDVMCCCSVTWFFFFFLLHFSFSTCIHVLGEDNYGFFWWVFYALSKPWLFNLVFLGWVTVRLILFSPTLCYLIRAEAHYQEAFATAQSRALVDYIFSLKQDSYFT